MRIAAEVIGRPLMLGGARINIGERVLLDPQREQHREVLESGWVRRLDAAALPVVTTAVTAPTAHKMIESARKKAPTQSPARNDAQTQKGKP